MGVRVDGAAGPLALGANFYTAFGGENHTTALWKSPLWGLRVQAPLGAWVQKVQRVQRVMVGASNL